MSPPPVLVRDGLRMGGIALDGPFVQAALSGYSDRPMRLLARRHGASYTVHEVLIDRFVREARNAAARSRHFEVGDDEHPVGAQLMGSEPASFPPAARRLVDAGYDVIDVNFGCPVRSAIGGCRGGYHLGQPDVALRIVRAVLDAVPDRPVTVKMRRGIDDTEASREAFYRILDGVFEAGVAAVTVHGRTVEQKYVGPSDWSFLREVKARVGRRVVLGSGDLFTADDALRMIDETGVDGVSIARGAIGNPWIFEACRDLAAGRVPTPPDLARQRATIEAHRDLLAEHVGPTAWLTPMRRHAVKYARHHPDADTVRAAFGGARTTDEFDAVLDLYRAEERLGPAPSASAQDFEEAKDHDQ